MLYSANNMLYNNPQCYISGVVCYITPEGVRKVPDVRWGCPRAVPAADGQETLGRFGLSDSRGTDSARAESDSDP